ncbi:MAG: sarcosine oxidase subunit delta [Alphaproteobacteria bacterium]|nr:sarcosine oxidase subunit delta [Alphaproteobacteria bacterium]
MHRIDCPWCGVRDEIEFAYRGDATVRRPEAGAGIDAFYAYVYERGNPRGWHVEWWHHAAGCRQWIKVLRHTLTHEIRATAKAGDTVTVPKP